MIYYMLSLEASITCSSASVPLLWTNITVLAYICSDQGRKPVGILDASLLFQGGSFTDLNNAACSVSGAALLSLLKSLLLIYSS